MKQRIGRMNRGVEIPKILILCNTNKDLTYGSTSPWLLSQNKPEFANTLHVQLSNMSHPYLYTTPHYSEKVGNKENVGFST